MDIKDELITIYNALLDMCLDNKKVNLVENNCTIGFGEVGWCGWENEISLYVTNETSDQFSTTPTDRTQDVYHISSKFLHTSSEISKKEYTELKNMFDVKYNILNDIEINKRLLALKESVNKLKT